MATVTTTELSNEMIERIANEAAGIVCERIGNALMEVGIKISITGMLVGLGCMAVGTYMNRRRGCPCHKEGSPTVIRCTDPTTGVVTRYCAASKLAD
jgi:hypothetical protein